MSFFLTRNPDWHTPAQVWVSEPMSLNYGGSWKAKDDLPKIGVCTSGTSFLGDFFRTGMQFYISAKLKVLLESHCPQDIELYPFSIEDEQGEIVSDSFSLLNILGIEDCLDLDAMAAEMWLPPGATEQRIKRRKGIFKRTGFSTRRLIWRPRLKETHVVVEPVLREAFYHAGIDGAEFREFPVATVR